MTDLMARLVAVTCGFLLAAAVGVLYVTSHPGLGGTAARAEFEDTFPLLPGMYVREFGAIAGSVRDVELTDRGTALVTLQLNNGTQPPSKDATAAIRQQDITGDSYVSLDPGNDPEPLGDTVIPTRRTLVAPRFDDLLNSFNEPTRAGLQLLLIELGKALEGRGENLNGATLNLRRVLVAGDDALTEVQSQNQALRQIVVDAERVTGQAGSRSQELGSLVESLGATLRTTASHGAGLDKALEVAPQTATTARGVLAKVRVAATVARPLAETLRDAAPGLATASRRLAPFIDDAAPALADVTPTVRLVTRLLHAAEPTLEAAPKRALTAPFDLASGIGGLLNTLLGEPKLMKALFGADAYGVGQSRLDDVGLGALGVEQGTLPGYEGNDPERRFLRAVAILNCETFGLPIGPGCLADFLGAPKAKHPGAKQRQHAGPVTHPPLPHARRPHPRLRDLPDKLRHALEDLPGRLHGLLDGLGLGGPKKHSSHSGALHDLFDFVFGP